MYLLWRFFYGLIDTKLIVALAGAFVRLVTRLKGESFAQGLLSLGERTFVFSGWPGHPSGWVNLHMSRFFWRIRRRAAPAKFVATRSPRSLTNRRLRVGCVGKFSGLLSFPKELFGAFPKDADLVVIDLAYGGRQAPYLRPLASDYVAVDLDDVKAYASNLQRGAEAINRADLDLLLNVGWKKDTYDLLDLIETPCIANYCTGADILHHEKVAMQLYSVPQAGYFLRDHAIFCATTRSRFGSALIYPINGYYDRRNVDIARQPPWRERESMIVFHGSLYKLARAALLDLLFDLMANDSALHFVIMGKDDGLALAQIRETAGRRGCAARTHYEGQFASLRNGAGEIEDAGWQKLLSYLRRARLAPDPWPLGSGSARCEAYLAGAPSVHMGVRFDRASWGRPQLAVYEIPALGIAAGTAWSADGYSELCRKCLYDESYAARLVHDQSVCAQAATDGFTWWREVMASYAWWQAAGTQAAKGLALATESRIQEAPFAGQMSRGGQV